MKKDKQPDLQSLYSMTELPPVEMVRIKAASIPHVNQPDPMWETLTLDDRDLLFSQALGEVVAQASHEQQLTIKGFVEDDVALAVASKATSHLT
jgi:hypothetical protein